MLGIIKVDESVIRRNQILKQAVHTTVIILSIGEDWQLSLEPKHVQRSQVNNIDSVTQKAYMKGNVKTKL